jgi:hypothetical protein
LCACTFFDAKMCHFVVSSLRDCLQYTTIHN